jgi:hypothetical protein
MAGIPAGSNFFSSLFTTLSRRKVADLFAAIGFDVRKSGWYDFELFSPWAELVIEAEAPILMHGSVSDVLIHAETLLDCLRGAEVSFDAECYDPDGVRLREWRVIF